MTAPSRTVSSLAGLLLVGTAFIIAYEGGAPPADMIASTDAAANVLLQSADRATDAAVMFFGGLAAFVSGFMVYAGIKRR